MAAYCVDFVSDAPYLFSDEGDYESFWDFQSLCPRGWVVIQSQDFRDIYAASQAGGSPGVTQQFTETEVAALKWQAANPSPFNLSIPDGALVGGAIVATWAVAWGLRQLVQTLGVSDGNSSE
ncbi:MAG: hypothetical protein KKD97_11505 [Gammaproteobacteria bacterium]|nr:hypothetical protein [Gammaproteobacteria bacterium]